MLKIKDLMKKVVSTEKDLKLKEAARIMSKMRIGSLVFIKDNNIAGILTERDVIKNISNLEKKISKIATKKVITVDLNRNMDYAAQLMAKNKIKRLCVTEKGKLVGIITATDIIANSDVLNEESFF
jgi:CBS domain-containing protein